MVRQAGKDHGDMVAEVFVPRAGDHHSRTPDNLAVGRLNRQCHLRPGGEGRRTAELYPATMNDD